jgi:hypothetical protein
MNMPPNLERLADADYYLQSILLTLRNTRRKPDGIGIAGVARGGSVRGDFVECCGRRR